MPRVSVIVPIYGVEKYIERCARSLFEQTLDDIEYIFVDDCTQDKSMEILQTVIHEYPNREGSITILHNENNKGLPQTRLVGLQKATGDYVIHCDSDDWVERDMYEKLYNKAVEGDYDVCICDYRFAGDDFLGDRMQCYYGDEDYLTSLLRCRITGSLCNKLVRRELYKTPDFVWPTETLCEDYACSIQVAMMKPRVGYMPEALYNYYKHPGSIVAGNTKARVIEKQKQNTANYRIVEQSLESRNLKMQYKQAFLVYKLAVKNGIRPYVYDEDILRMWRKSFRGLGLEIWQSKYISLRMRVAYLFTVLGLYPKIGKVKNFSDA